MPKLAELLAQRRELNAAIEAARAEHRQAAIQEIKALIADYGLTPFDLGTLAMRVPRKKVAAKYRGADGQEWSGRGSKPRWLKDALHAGASLDAFHV